MDEFKPRKSQARPRNLKGPNGLKLKQVAYQFFSHDIAIYHYLANYTSVVSLRKQFNRADHGYVDTLLSSDPILSLKTPLPEDDVIPRGRVEVAYLPEIFYLGGSALGFRMGKGTVHWMCFDQPIDQTILQHTISGKPRTKNSLMLFDHVGTLEKSVEDRKGTYRTSEHRGWHHSLKMAYHRPLKLRLTWRNFGTESKAHRDAQRKGHSRAEMKTDGLFVRDHVQTTTKDNIREEEQEDAYGLVGMYDSYEYVEDTRTRSKTPRSRPYMSPPKSDSDVLGN